MPIHIAYHTQTHISHQLQIHIYIHSTPAIQTHPPQQLHIIQPTDTYAGAYVPHQLHTYHNHTQSHAHTHKHLDTHRETNHTDIYMSHYIQTCHHTNPTCICSCTHYHTHTGRYHISYIHMCPNSHRWMTDTLSWELDLLGYVSISTTLICCV